MDHSANLSLEQEFDLKVFTDRVQSLTSEQAKQFLVELHRQMMIRDNLYRELLKQFMGINP